MVALTLFVIAAVQGSDIPEAWRGIASGMIAAAAYIKGRFDPTPA